MSSPPIVAFLSLSMLSMLASGCAPQQVAPPRVASVAPATPTDAGGSPRNMGGERHVYRFDFVLTSTEGASPPTSTAFTLNLEEFNRGEVLVGKNVPLAAPGPPAALPRQDVGTKVVAKFRSVGDDVLLDVSTAMSAFEPPSSIRKVESTGSAVATAGRSSLVSTLDTENKRYQLTVTPTKLR